ncbi:MAG: motility associated factor glycosyltransferase family protein [Gracilibacteraceae bacterium]|jgi:hypothetical protein|nr:motility associated factor glycosyltransferase family protein [Gracilibacteraceae bacterium]
MNYYDLNMELIKKNHDYLYKNLIKDGISHTNRLDAIETVKARDGENILLITYKGNTYRLNSMYRPAEEAKRWSEQYKFQNIKTVISMFGIGNGIFARAIIERMDESQVLVLYEPCYDIFIHVINNYDLSDILSDKRILIAVEGVNDFEFHLAIQSLIDVTNIKSQVQLIYPNYDHIFTESCVKFFKEIKDSMTSSRININTIIKLSERSIYNLFKNLIYLPNCMTLNDLKNYIPTHLPAIVVAAGPSVEENIEDLKRAKGKAVIFACDRILEYLLDKGVEPDFVVTVDPMKERRHFSLRDDVSVPLICTIHANHDILRHHVGEKIFCTSNFLVKEILNMLGREASNIPTGGSVAVSAFTACVNLGFKRVILVGQDLAYSGNVSHAGGEVDARGENDYILIEGIDGNMIKSRYDWKEFVIEYQDLIAVNPDVEVIDAKRRGARIKGTVVMPLNEALEQYCPADDRIESIEFGNRVIADRKIIDNIVAYLEGYIPVLKRISDEAETAVRKCNIVIRDNGRGLSGKNINDSLKRLKQINSFIREQEIYNLMDSYITSVTANQLSELLIVSENEEEYNLSTFQKSKIIYEAVIDASKYIMKMIKEAIEELKNHG